MRQFLRVLNQAAIRHNLQVNGGGRQVAIRSFADTARDKRVRFYLTRDVGCALNDEEVV